MKKALGGRLVGRGLWVGLGLWVLVWGAAGVAGAQETGAGAEPAAPELQQFLREFRQALAQENAAHLALLVRFPLRVNFHGVTQIADPAALAHHFSEIFPGPLRAAIDKSTTDDIACFPSGCFLANGAVWFDRYDEEGTLRYRAFTINVPGEIARYPKAVLACSTAKHRILIEAMAEDQYRYRAWNWPRSFDEKPDLELSHGKMDYEGTGVCGHAIWSFTNGDIRYTLAELACGPGDEPEGAHADLVVARGEQELATFWCF